MSDILTDADLAAIAERERAATPGPWAAHCRDISGELDSNAVSGLGWELAGPPEPMLRGQFARGQDAIFSAHARQDVPALLATVAALRERVAALEADRTALLAAEVGPQATVVSREYLTALERYCRMRGKIINADSLDFHLLDESYAAWEALENHPDWQNRKGAQHDHA